MKKILYILYVGQLIAFFALGFYIKAAIDDNKVVELQANSSDNIPLEFVAPATTSNLENITLSSDGFSLKTNCETIVAHVADTGSMKPIMDSSSLVILDKEQVKVNDFAIYVAEDGGWVVHQIIGEQDGKWIFKGVNNQFQDDLVEKSAVIYRVKAVIY